LRIAILGALGFLGKELSRNLASLGHEVTGFTLHEPSVQPENFFCRPVSSLIGRETSPDDHFDVVVNVAARRSTKSNLLSAAKIREFNFEIPREFIIRASRPGTMVVNTSTYIQNFEGVDGNTVDAYGKGKQELTQFLKEESQLRGFTTLDLFLFTVYGIGDRPNHLVPTLISAAKNGEEVRVSEGYQLLNLIHLNDVVHNFINAISTKDQFSYRRHFVWQEDYFSVRKLVSTIESIAGCKINCLWGERPYAGHEMFEPWSIPMSQLPSFESRITLEEGIRELWSNDNNHGS
jgi:nucleoside-diphosphate-sugar epimerase